MRARPSAASASRRRSNGASAPGSSMSRPYQARSWATSTISATPPSTSERASASIDSIVARALLAAERRDRAERARAVAALGDLHVRPRHARRRPRQLQQVSHAASAVRPRRRRLPPGHTEEDGLGDRALAAEPDHGVDLGQRRGELVAVALGHAPRHHELGARVGGPRPARGSCRSTPGGPPR